MEDHVITFLADAIRRNRIVVGTRVIILAFQLVTPHDAASHSITMSERWPVIDREPALSSWPAPPARRAGGPNSGQ
jgi:hypothetical protein